MTDEELKQTYGIHLATRLEADEPGGSGQPNWADIDDDDDDWVPETIQWQDGTKIKLPSADDPPPPREPTPPPAVVETVAIPVLKSRSPAPPQASPSPTVKPSGFGGGRTGLVLKGAADKPTLVAKPPGPPTPVKSPWAPLPPVDKVAPVVIELPIQQNQGGRFAQRDPHSFANMPPPPAKEIAADDFSRAGWRENNANTRPELFNSQSGRYEPVNDRRASRIETHARQPAVLQRPSPGDGPAEPSPAFQTHHTSAQSAAFGRRRTSSNVSGGSGNFSRRLSRGHDMPPPSHEILGVRRGSLAAVNDVPSSPSGQYANAAPHRQNPQWQSRSPVVSHPSPHSTHSQPHAAAQENQAPVTVNVDEVFENQKKEMRAKRELAIKRRQEEEAKEEAARKERIRIKLEAMGPLPEKKETLTPKEEKPISIQIQTRQPANSAPAPAPEVDAKLKVTASEPLSPTQFTATNDPKRVVDHEIRPNGVTRQNNAPSSMSTQQERPAQQTWQAKKTSTWGAPPAPQSSNNVWGPPSALKSLGNGTFDPDLSILPSPAQRLGQGHPLQMRGNDQYQQGRGREYASRPNPIGPPSRQAEQPQRKMAAGWGELPEQLAKEDALAAQAVVAERSRRQELQDQGLLPEAAQPVFQETWRKVALNEDGTRSKVQGKIKQTHDSSAQQTVQDEATVPPTQTFNIMQGRPEYSQPPPVQYNEWGSGGPSAITRPSRFFNNNKNRDVRLDEANVSLGRPGSPSPPPPTMEGHPAYEGGLHVNLPKPLPVVRLPPMPTPIHLPKQIPSFAAIVTGPTQGRGMTAAQDVRNVPGQAEAWKNKISNLFSGPSVDSTTKNALALEVNFETTVSLPASVSGDLAQDDTSVTSKPAATRCFEEPEMGSSPPVKLPSKAPANAWSLSSTPKTSHAAFTHKQITSVSTIQFEAEKPGSDEGAPPGSTKINIKIPGQETATHVYHASPHHRNNNRGRGSGRYRGVNNSRGRGAAAGPASPAPSVGTPTQPSRARRGGAGRGGGRGNGRGGNHASGADLWHSHAVPAPAAIAS